MDEQLSAVLTPGSIEADNPLSDQLYTVAQVANVLRLPTTWIYERTRKNAIPYHKFGKYIRFTTSDLSKILIICSRGPRSEVIQVGRGEL
jgi:excisionase family DNA binding protein